MDTLRELYKIGCWPSSSHTMWPERAARVIKTNYPQATHIVLELRGSLAATGKGHLTDWIVIETLKPMPVEVIRKSRFVHPFHSNGMKFILYRDQELLGEEVFFSVWWGTIKTLAEIENPTDEKDQKSDLRQGTYPHRSLEDIMKWCATHQKELWQYVEHYEGEEIREYLEQIAIAMDQAVERGLHAEWVLPGPLKLSRKAKAMYQQALMGQNPLMLTNKIFAYSLAVAEENASAGLIVTAPTCGSAGVIPGLLRAMREEYHLTKEQILRGLAIWGLIWNLFKHNATISGAEWGCQAEIGVACSMASAMAVFWLGGSIEQMEYAAESGMEHHLGMTCDPVGGFVQIPCIERNAIVATRALNTALYCMAGSPEHTISFDEVVQTMKETGRDLCPSYRETSLAGLARHYEKILLENWENDDFTRFEEFKDEADSQEKDIR